MKTRHGFVSNSSSSSFVVKEKHLNDLQKLMIINHIEFSELFSKLDSSYKNYNSQGDKWNIEIKDGEIRGFTYMDNFSMGKFLKYIDAPVLFLEGDG